MAKPRNYFDVHCHILPGIDDGPRDLEASTALARAYAEDGAIGLIATPHVSLGSDLDAFVSRRNEALKRLKAALSETMPGFGIKVGSEVMMKHKEGVREAYADLGRHSKELCLADSNLILVEYALTGEPLWFEESLYRLQELGLQPVVAHMERYSWLKDKARVGKLVDKGIYMQVNVTSLKGMFSVDAIRARMLLKSGLVHFVATDSHSVEERSPKMAKADARLMEDALNNSEKLFSHDGKDILYL